MNNPIKVLTKRDYVLWSLSIAAIILSNIIPGEFDVLTLIAAVVGATSLILAARGNVWAQVLMIIFSILYGIISYRFHYWGEMVTYLGMTMPMAIWSLITWLKNPSEENQGQVKIQILSWKKWLILLLVTTIVTVVFYYILRGLDTPNIVFSTISIATSFLAAALTMLRSSYFAITYASNDVVLIVLWILASLESPSYVPVVVNFVIFLMNDLYGFISWKKREKKC